MNDLPDITDRRNGDGTLELDFTVDPDSSWFDGHFPDRPILPGVVQIGWAAHFAADLCGRNEPPAQLERIKFRRPILPGACLTLRLARVSDKVRYEYLLQGEDAPVSASSGVLAYVDAA